MAITFDDGYRDNLELAVPELERLGLPATFFLVPGLLDRRVEPWWEAVAWAVTEATAPEATIAGERVVLGDPSERRAVRRRAEEHLKRRDHDAREAALAEMVDALRPRPRDDLKELFLDWPGARELAGRGFEIGSHSSHHAILSEEPPRRRWPTPRGVRGPRAGAGRAGHVGGLPERRPARLRRRDARRRPGRRIRAGSRPARA